ncbi:MAG: hypothetical protein ACYS1C_09115 [Planctomycetota bacterium]|jgi:hypothetical protein
MGESALLIALVVLNVGAGLGLAVPLAAVVASASRAPWPRWRWSLALVGAYFVEGIALGLGMTIPIFNVALAFVWGVAVWVLLARNGEPRAVLRASVLFSLYCSLPAVSLLAVPAAVALGGGNVLSIEAGSAFGIPALSGPLSPLSTILGFYLALAAGAVLLKAVITTGEVSLLMRVRARRNLA